MFKQRKVPFKVARIVSFIFDGSVLALPIFLAVCFYRQNKPAGILSSFFISIFFTALIPYLFILFLYKTKRISDLQIPKRKERVVPLIIINISIMIGFLILLLSDSTRLLKTVYLVYLTGLPVLSIITMFWKISFHSSYITMFSMIYLLVFGKWALFTLLLIPLVSWSRLKLQRHTINQVLMGIIITGFISSIMFYINGYFTSSYWSVNEIFLLLGKTYTYLGIDFFLNSIDILVLTITIILFGNFRKSAGMDYLFNYRFDQTFLARQAMLFNHY